MQRWRCKYEGIEMGTPKQGTPKNRSKNVLGIYLPEPLYAYYIPTLFLGFPACGPDHSPFILGVGARGLLASSGCFFVCCPYPSYIYANLDK